MTTQHPRALIRQALRARIGDPVDGTPPTDAGTHVYASRTIPLWPASMPAVVIYTRQERIDPESPRGDEMPLRRFLTAVAEIYAAGSDADEVADRVAAQIETRVVTGDTLGGLVESTHLQTTDIDLTGDGETPVVMAEMAWEIAYYTVPTLAPEGVLPQELYLNLWPPFGTAHEDDYHRVREVP
jgi:hypothetical protein